MKLQKKDKFNLEQLNESLKFAQEVDRKIQEFNDSSAKIAEKWQKKVEDKNKRFNH